MDLFRYIRLAPGVYAAVDPLTNGGFGGCNAGIIDLGNQTLVFDTGVVPKAGRELRTASVKLTGRFPGYAVVSHYHNDHIRGSQAFRESVEVATTLTRKLIATKGPADLRDDRAATTSEMARMRLLARSKDKRDAEEVAFMMPYWKKMQASLPEVRLRLPDLVFEGELTFHGTKRVAHLIAFEHGHCESDCVLFLPKERILFCGDLLFTKSHPYLGHGDPESLISILERLGKMKADVYVPGHGPLGKKKDVDELISYVRMLSNQARSVLRNGGTEEEAARQPMPERFSDWMLGDMFYEFNMRFLLRQLARKGRRAI
jgi:cyclase